MQCENRDLLLLRRSLGREEYPIIGKTGLTISIIVKCSIKNQLKTEGVVLKNMNFEGLISRF